MLSHSAPDYSYAVSYQTTSRRTRMATAPTGCIEAPYVSWSPAVIRLFATTTEGCLIVNVKSASRITNVIAVFALAVGISALGAPAQADEDDDLWAVPVPIPGAAMERNGICEKGEICFYHNSNLGGSVSDFFSDVKDYGTSQPGCYEFKGPGEGQGECMDHNVASVWNRTGEVVSIYKDSECQGDHAVVGDDEIPQNLSDLIKNKNASHCIG